MLKIDNSLLVEVGLGGLPDADKNSFLKHIYETLEMRVGVRLADQMTNEQLDEFERYFEAKDDAGAFKWLETNFPNYKEIVQQEFDKLKAEVAQSAPQILAASQAQAAQPPATAQPGTGFPPPPVPGQPQPSMPAPPQQPQPQPLAQPYTYAAAPTPPQPQQQPPASPMPPTPPPAPNPAPSPEPVPPMMPPYPHEQPPAGPGVPQQ
ncbi:MAG TPA: DUF5663 domain-containing protein [Candidatus Dormibacteraeota bacterium]|nr:DUF5663 domain-containing protein [Candidatus Dormibacteraeota bacterium]